MQNKIKAKNNYVLLIRDIPEEEKMGLLIPDSAKKKPQTGTIFSIGSLVQDKTIKNGEKAYFHMTAGFEMEIEGETIFCLREQDVIACV